MAKPKVKLSSHADLRFKERTQEEKKEFISLSRSAYKKGLMWLHIEILEPEFKKTKEGKVLKRYMKAYQNRKKKFYRGYIFIFSSSTRKVITMYPCKEEYLETLNNFWEKVYVKNDIYNSLIKK